MAEERDFFISYNKADHGWAEWIAWQLEAEGYTTILHAWDFRPGENFVLKMHEATKNAKRTIAVLSPSYLTSLFAQPEWGAAFVQDPTGKQGKLLPIRVHECEPEGLLQQIIYIDLVNLDKIAASNALRAGVRQSRALPAIEPLFPRDVSTPLPPVPSFPGEWPEIWQVPYPRNPFFTGRKELLTRVRERLSTMSQATLSQAQAISGLGGIGKTQTALEYAYRYGHRYRYVLWVSAVDEETLRAELVQLTVLLHVSEHNPSDPSRTIEALKRWFVQQSDWLLILDNADNLEMASQYVPSRRNHLQGHIVLTTRAASSGAFAQIIEVETMNQEEGVLLLMRRAHLLVTDAGLNRSSKQDQADAQAIVTILDGLPLAIDQAGAYIEEMEISLASYLALYQQRRKELHTHRGQLPPGHPETVATTWDLSFQQIEQANPAATDLLRLCAFLAPDAIPEKILVEGASALGKRLEAVAADPYLLNAALHQLRRYSLIRRNPQARTLSVHRLVQAVLQDAMSPRERRTWAERAISATNAVFPSERWLPIEDVLPHALRCANLINDYQISFLEAGRLLDRLATYLQDAARYKEAELLFERALAIYEKTRGPKHPETSSIINNLALLYRTQERYEEAEPLYLRALAIKEKTRGPEHPSTSVTLDNLALLYRDQGRYEEAESLYLRALAIKEKMQGPEHPSTSVTLDNLAGLYQDRGRYEEAEPLYLRALAIREKTRGLEHPETSATLNNLALLYREQGRYEEAEPLLERALAIKEKTQGPEHPDTSATISNLALLYREQGRYEEAEPLYQRALSIDTKCFGPEHLEVVVDLEAYANLLQKMDRLDEAAQLLARAQAIRAKQKS